MTALPSDVLQQTYRCASAPDLWPQTLQRISACAGGSRILVQRARREGLRMQTRWAMADPCLPHGDFLARLEDATNPRMAAYLSPPVQGVAFFRDEERLDASAPDVRRLHQLEAQFGYRRFIGARIELKPGETLLMALYAEHQDAFGSETEQVLREAMPHLAQAVSLGGEFEELRQWRRMAGGALDMLSMGVVLCTDKGGTAQYANRAAHNALEDAAVRLESDRLVARAPVDVARLQCLLDRAGQGQPGGARFGAGPAAVDLLATMEPAIPGAIAVMVSRPSARTTPPVAPLGEIYGLTAAEAALAAAICAGSNVNDYAAARGIAIATARCQLRQVLAKTGASRQSDLVRQVWASALAACVVQPS